MTLYAKFLQNYLSYIVYNEFNNQSIARRKILKRSFNSLDYLTVIKYLIVFFCFLVFSKLEHSPQPYSAALYISALSSGLAIIPTTLLYFASTLILGATGLLGTQAIISFVTIIITLIYSKQRAKIRLEFTACALLGMLGYVFLGDTMNQVLLEKRIFVSILTVILTFICLISTKAVCEKGLKFKLGFEEFASLIVMVSIFGIGICNFISPYFWRAVAVLMILIVCYIYRTGIATITSAVFGISFAIYFNNLIFVAVFLCLALSAESLMNVSRYLSAVAVIMCDYLIQLIFGVYGEYSLIHLISILSGAAIFCIIPTKPLKNLKETLYSFRERQLTRQTINRSRLMLSGKLYDLSNVFQEMSVAFTAFEKKALTEEKAKELMQKQVLSGVCAECEHVTKCKQNELYINFGLSKMIDIGLAKGKLSLIDLPKELGDTCIRPNNILYALNKLLADFRAHCLEHANLKSGREIIASQAQGVSEILKTLALETGSQLKYQSRLERTLADKLFKGGIFVSELLIYGEEDRFSVSMIIAMKEFSVERIQRIVSQTLSLDMIIVDSAKITEDKCFLALKCASEYDAVYGLSHAKKDGSEMCGDTHSVTRVAGDRLLVALSDGMGSGKTAESISSTSLSLIESFYKAGISSPLILNTVNKLLAINTEDTFTALDMSVIDLKTCTADFIKYGAPYGFIIGENGVRIVEGNTLPLGILDELKPSVCSTNLSDGDVLLLVTDGISDAFSSSSEIIDFLRAQPAKNPQTLTDDLLTHAIKLTNGEKRDDMTALAVRIFKRKTA